MALNDQPGYVIRMRAKSGRGDRLFELATEGMFKSGASDRFITSRVDVHPHAVIPELPGDSA